MSLGFWFFSYRYQNDILSERHAYWLLQPLSDINGIISLPFLISIILSTPFLRSHNEVLVAKATLNWPKTQPWFYNAHHPRAQNRVLFLPRAYFQKAIICHRMKEGLDSQVLSEFFGPLAQRSILKAKASSPDRNLLFFSHFCRQIQ